MTKTCSVATVHDSIRYLISQGIERKKIRSVLSKSLPKRKLSNLRVRKHFGF